METSQDLQFPFLAFYIEQNCCKYSKSCIRTLWVYSLFEHLTLSRSELGTHGCLVAYSHYVEYNLSGWIPNLFRSKGQWNKYWLQPKPERQLSNSMINSKVGTD